MRGLSSEIPYGIIAWDIQDREDGLWFNPPIVLLEKLFSRLALQSRLSDCMDSFTWHATGECETCYGRDTAMV